MWIEIDNIMVDRDTIAMMIMIDDENKFQIIFHEEKHMFIHFDTFMRAHRAYNKAREEWLSLCNRDDDA